MSGWDVCRILESQGFIQVRQRGSHVTMQRVLPNTTITAIVPLCDEVRLGTLSSIIRQSGLPRHLFETK